MSYQCHYIFINILKSVQPLIFYICDPFQNFYSTFLTCTSLIRMRSTHSAAKPARLQSLSLLIQADNRTDLEQPFVQCFSALLYLSFCVCELLFEDTNVKVAKHCTITIL